MQQEYFKRVIDSALDLYLETFGAVLIEGVKGSGKTTLALTKAKSALLLEDSNKSQGYLLTADVKPSLLLAGEKPRLIDEWQMAPVLWDAVRTVVDAVDKEEQYILTSSFAFKQTQTMHSGIGRIGRLKMYPMTLYESRESNGLISLSELFNNKNLNIDGIKSQLTIPDLVFAACRGGWPLSLEKETDKAKLTVSKNIVKNIISTDISIIDGIKREPEKVRYLLRSYARNIGTLVSNKKIRDDVKLHTNLSETTFYEYINALERLFVIEDIPAWSPSIRTKTSIRTSNKRMFIDPSIAVVALETSYNKLLQDFETFGFIFENLCIRDLKVYASALGGRISYYKDKKYEVDAVLHLKDGRYALIEFKLGAKQIEEAAEHLLAVKNLIKAANEKKKTNLREPDLLLIITGGKMAYTRNDRVKIIPIGCLKD